MVKTRSSTVNMGQTSNQQSASAKNQGILISSQPQAKLNIFQQVSVLLSGRKTYITAVAMIIYAVLGVYLKYMQSTDAITLILQALGISALRAGIAKQGS